MKKITIISVLMGFVALFAFKPIALFSVPKGWPKPVYDFKNNPLSESNIQLGRKLFYDPILSRDSSISCSSCHLQYTAFTHVDHDLSHGIDNRIGTRNSPALMNLAWSSSLMWDGAVNHLDMLALAPISNSMEMDESIAGVVLKMQRGKTYPKLFYLNYKDSTITGVHVLKPLSQFLLTLVSSNAKYDRVKLGKETFTEQENKGYILFQKHCNVCHTEPLFTNGKFENNGLLVDNTLNDIGLMKTTGLASDSLKFKVPTLRNIEFSYPYMHDGRFKSLNLVLNHYIRGIQPTATINPVLGKGILLSSDDKADLVAFLLTLTDKEFLFNKKFSFPKN